jgi:hypothetical protein
MKITADKTFAVGLKLLVTLYSDSTIQSSWVKVHICIYIYIPLPTKQGGAHEIKRAIDKGSVSCGQLNYN